jgi:hypothetical protein
MGNVGATVERSPSERIIERNKCENSSSHEYRLCILSGRISARSPIPLKHEELTNKWGGGRGGGEGTGETNYTLKNPPQDRQPDR